MAPSRATTRSSAQPRKEPPDLGPRAPQPIHVWRPSRRQNLHQRRRSGHLGRDQQRRCRSQRRLAHHRGPDERSAVRQPDLRLQPFVGRLCDYGRCLLRADDLPFPSDYVNDYFFADFCAGWIRKLDLDSRSVTTFATGLSYPVDLKVADDGSLVLPDERHRHQHGSGVSCDVRFNIADAERTVPDCAAEADQARTLLWRPSRGRVCRTRGGSPQLRPVSRHSATRGSLARRPLACSPFRAPSLLTK